MEDLRREERERKGREGKVSEKREARRAVPFESLNSPKLQDCPLGIGW